MAAGLSVKAAAAKAGLGERTAYRRLADPEFQESLAEARKELVQRAIAKLTAAGTKAANKLAQLLKSGNPSVERLAAVNILELRLKISEVEQIERRLEALENLQKGRMRNGN